MLAVFIWGILLVTSMEVSAKFSSFHCKVFDKNFGEFPICTIKEINRFRNTINFLYRQKQAAKKVMVGFSLNKLITQQLIFLYILNKYSQVRLEVFKKSLGVWRPFIYNITMELCEFLGKENNAVMKMAFTNLKPYLTLKNSCPFKVNKRLRYRKYILLF